MILTLYFFYSHRILIAETTSESFSRSVTVAVYTFAAQTRTIQRTTWSTWVYYFIPIAVCTVIYYACSRSDLLFVCLSIFSPIWHIFPDTSTCPAWAWARPNVRTTRWTTQRPFGLKRAIRGNCRLCTVEQTPSSPKRTQLSSERICTTWPRDARSSRSRGRSNTTPTG